MNIFKYFPKKFREQLKKYLRNKLGFPQNIYQNVHLVRKIENYHSNKFDKFHTLFASNDKHLNYNSNSTRFRNYNNYKFAELALRNNPRGSFLSVGISYGTSVKVITHVLDHIGKNNDYYLIDDYKNRENNLYNIDVKNVKKDLTNIKNFNFIFLEKILSQSILDQINDNLAFVHLNTGDFKVEFQYFDKIINKCLKNAILIVDNYGFLKKDDQTMYDEYLKANQKLYSYVSPSLQLVVMVK